jgi:hypothetical protein
VQDRKGVITFKLFSSLKECLVLVTRTAERQVAYRTGIAGDLLGAEVHSECRLIHVTPANFTTPCFLLVARL